MSQALMPGDEPIEIKFKPQEVYVAPPPPAQFYSDAQEGCNCPACRHARLVAQNIPAGYPRNMPEGLIRGRYDFSQSRDGSNGLQGQVRWRAPDTLMVYDSDGLSQWTYEEELPDGTLIDRSGRRWVPDPPAIRTNTPVFNWDWESEPVRMGDYFDTTAMSRFP